MSAMISLWFTKGFSVVQTRDVDETVEFIQHLFEKTSKETDEKDYVSTIKIKKKDKLTPENVDILMLSQIPTISTVTAKALLQQFETMFKLTQTLKENPDMLSGFTYGEKKRKISKKSIETLKLFLHI
jgi:ERCC4-type nuclease